MVHLAGALRYFLPMDGEQCFFFRRFIAIFLLLKNPGYQYKGGFHLKSPKTAAIFFWGEAGC
jgi:hypothetical protein